MQAVVFLGNRQTELREVPDPTPGPRDVILEIRASGMCGSDLHVYRVPRERKNPNIAGHEPCGVVVEVGASVTEREARVGQRVMDHHYEGCGVCRHCSSGWAQMCLEGTTVYGVVGDGAHANYMRVPVSTLVPLPDELSFQSGAAISCGTGTAFGALRRLALKGDETIVIFGQGPVGLSATQLAVAMGARTIVLDISPERRTLASALGAHVVLDPLTDDVVSAVHELTHGEGADKTLDTSSSPQARAQAVRCTRAWGACCYVGEGGDVQLEVSPDLIRRQITLMGSWTFSTVGQADCARFVADRKIDVDRLFTDRWTLAQAEQAYQLFDQQKSGKGVFLPNGE
jgi:threonine dehydrogenase-like Zn-dependent dehydrogenase